MEPRTGKTKAALDAAAILSLKGEVQKVAIFAPLIAFDVWRSELKKHFPFPYTLTTPEAIYHARAGRRLPHVYPIEFRILNYEKVSRRVRASGGRRWRHLYLEEIEQWRPDLLICDESHRLKRAGGVASQATWRMVRRLRDAGRGDTPARRPYVFLLTGTPNPKGWIDLFAQLRVLDDSILGSSKADFEQEYVTYGHGKRRWTIIHYRNEKRLLRKVRAHSLSVSAEQAHLSNKVFWQTLTTQLPSEARRVYDEMVEEFVAEIGSEVITAANAGARRTRLLQITGGFTTDGVEIHRQKLALLEQYARLLADQGEQLLVYCRFLPEVHAAYAVLKDLGTSVQSIYGATPSGDRTKAIGRFQNRRLDALVFQVQSGSLAIELTASAEVVFYSLPDGWENYYQAYHRVLGPNQRRPVRVTHLEAVGTLDRSVLRSLQKKESQHDEMMQDPRGYLLGV